MKITFERLTDIDQVVTKLFTDKPDLDKTKFGYAFNKLAKKYIGVAFDEYRDALQDIRIEHALTDEKTQEILHDRSNPRGFKYSKDGLKSVIKAEKALIDEYKKKEYDIEPFIAEVPCELTEEQKEILKGVLI